MALRIQAHKKNGRESFTGMDKTILDYWSWAHSDIASNSERGKLAEFIVKTAVGSTSPYRVEWDAVDVVSPEGIRIEVKASAYLQSWNCSKLSRIQFDISPRKSWDSETNLYYASVGRNSDCYVFCLFACKDPAVANPMNMEQWEFYILPTGILDKNLPNQKTITLGSLKKLGAVLSDFKNIKHTILDIL